MRILIAGAQGFIGSAIAYQLWQAGHEIVATTRKKSQSNIYPYQLIECDFNRDVAIETWIPRLQHIDVIINCVGALQDKTGVSLEAIHYLAPKALYSASQQCGVKKIIHISALGADVAAQTPYALTKNAIEKFIHTLKMDWIILRPSLVYSTGSYGGTSLMRSIVATPFVIPMPKNIHTEFQPIFLADLAIAVHRLVEKAELTQTTYDLVGPEKVSYQNILLSMRRWLGFGKAKLLMIPLFMVKIAAKCSDWFGIGALNTTALKMLQYGNTTSDDNKQKCYNAIGFVPRGFTETLQHLPSYVQDRWHARLALLRPLLGISLGILWLGSGMASLLTPINNNYAILEQAGFSGDIANIALYGAIMIDIILGIFFLIGRRLKQVCIAALFIMVIYTAIITIKIPYLWFEPFAPLLKNIPIMVATLILLAIAEDR